MATITRTEALAIVRAIDAAVLEYATNGAVSQLTIRGRSVSLSNMTELMGVRAIYAQIANSPDTESQSIFGNRILGRLGKV